MFRPKSQKFFQDGIAQELGKFPVSAAVEALVFLAAWAAYCNQGDHA